MMDTAVEQETMWWPQVVAPGLSEYRAYISAHLAEPLYLLAKKRQALAHLLLEHHCMPITHFSSYLK